MPPSTPLSQLIVHKSLRKVVLTMLCYQGGRARRVKSVTAAQTVGKRQSSAVMTVVPSASLTQRIEREGLRTGSFDRS